MAKQLNVNMSFTADVSGAKKSLNDLQVQLTNLTNAPVGFHGKLTKEIKEASTAAAELKVHLEKATNPQTGNLDFSKFNQSIEKSGTTLADYGEKLNAMGPAGKQAFQQLAQSVAKAEIPIRRSNELLTNMWTSLKNTARWQISSSILHGFMGAIQSAYGYAQDLNESLNNIRIVTGYSQAEMAKFAEQANSAAKALSSTTTEYTNAALIYYQQGLSGTEIEERTAITLKMANVARQSAEIVSDQMTAVWNNFDDGSKSLEYYADVMTALGAATASSTDEIAQGLEKFSAIAGTVGLSYEYATAALATVTAETRQSADVVGTAFKTLFARIEGLQLGETLEDGTDLNKYSEALSKVGVDIKDASGELKSMDQILEELGARWQTLAKDEQIALAQTVAGVRQYNQLISLMDNWDVMQDNLNTAYGSSGALEEQAEIYAESWEAARDRVKAAAEAIYSDLLKDDFFIGALNGIEKFLTLIDQIIDRMGGLTGALSGIAALLLKVFSDKISSGIANMAYGFKMLTTSGRQAQQEAQKTFVRQAADSMSTGFDETIEDQTRANSMRGQLEIETLLIDKAKDMSEVELQINRTLLDRLRLLGEESAARSKNLDEAKERTANASTNLRVQAIETAEMWTSGSNPEERKKAFSQANEAVTTAQTHTRQNVGMENIISNSINTIRQDGEVGELALQKIVRAMEVLKKRGATAFDEILEDLPEVGDSAEIVEVKLRKIERATRDAVDELATADFADAGVLRPSPEGDEAIDQVGDYVDCVRDEISIGKEQQQSINAEKDLMGDLADRVQNASKGQKSWSDALVASAQSVSSITMGISSLGSAIDTISNPDLSPWEKFTGVLSSLAMGIPMVVTGFGSLIAQTKASNASMLEAIAVKTALMSLDFEELGIDGAQAASLIIETALTKGLTQAEKEKILMDKLGMTQEQAKLALESGVIAGKTKNIFYTLAEAVASKTKAIADKAETASTAGKTAGIWAEVTAKLASLAASWPLLAVTLLIVAAVAALVITIVAVVAIFNKLSDAYNKDAIAAQNAQEAAKGLAEAYANAKQEYEDMVSAMDNYKSAREGLDSLTEGTVEYREALKEANDAAMELIKAGNLVKDKDYTIENGEIIIKEGAMEDAKNASFNKMMDAQAASTMAAAKASQAQAKSNQTDLVREDDGSNIGKSILLSGGDIVTGAIKGALFNTVDNAVENSKIDKLTALYNDIGEAAFEASTLQSLGFDSANESYINSIKKVVEETSLAAQEMEVAAEVAASAVLEKNENYQDSKYKEEVASAAGDSYQALYDKAYEEALDRTKNEDGTGGKREKEAMKEYAEQMGLSDLNGYKVTNYKAGGNVEYEYIDENGEKKTAEVTQAQIAAQLAATEATKQLEESTQTLLDTFERLNKSTDKADQALAAFASGNLQNATKGEFSAMEGDLSDSITTNEDGTRELSEEGAEDYINANFSEAELTALGYESAEEAAAAFKTQFDANLQAWDSIELPENLIGTDSMSLTTAQAFENVLKDINLGPQGEKAGEQYVAGINEMVKDLDTEDQQAALEELANIDWSQWDAMDQAKEVMKQFNVNIDTGSQYWIDYANSMRIASGAFPDFSKIKTDLIEVSKILGDLDFGSVISDEDYNKLIDYNSAWEEHFILQADGSRKFIGDSEEMAKATRENINEQRKELESRRATAEAIEEAELDWDISAKSIDKEFGDGKDGKLSDETAKEHGYESGEDMINQEMAKKAESLVANEDVKKLLKDGGYSDEAIQEVIQEAKDGNRERLETMLTYVGDYMEEDYEKADAELNEMMASTATNIQELQDLLNGGEIDTAAYEKQLTVLAQSASSLEELKQIQASGIEGAGLDNAEYNDALLKLAENYDHCAEEAEKFNAALLSGDEAQIQAAQDALELSIQVGELSEKFGFEAEETENYAKRLAKSLGIDEKAAAKLAIQNQRLDRGLSNLNDNLEDYQKSLKKNAKNSAEWSKTMDALKGDLADVLNVADGSMLSDEFAEATLESEDFKKALDGDVEAIQRLQTKAADDIIINVVANQSDNPEDIKNRWEQLKADFEATDIDSPDVDQTNLINSFNQMIEKGNMTKDQIEAALSGLHASAEVVTTYVKQETQVPTYYEYSVNEGWDDFSYTDSEGNTVTQKRPKIRKMTVPGDPVTVEGHVPKYEIKGTEGEGGVTTAFTSAPPPTVSNSSTSSGKGGGGGGGGSKKKTSESRKKKSDMVDRYKEINDQLEKTSRQMNKTSIAADGLWGAKRFNMLKKNIDLMKQEHKQLEKKYDLAKKYLKEDKNALVQAGTSKEAKKNLGMSVNFKFDESGAITNYTEQMTALYKKREALLNSFGSEMDEKETERLEKFDESFDKLKEAYEQYETTLDEKQDLEEEKAQKKLETQEAYLNLLNEELELKVSINDADLEVLDYYLSKIEGDLYAAAEGMKYMGEQAMLYEDNLIDQQDQYDKLNKAYQDGEINMAQYKESMKELQSATISNLQSLQESKTAMQDYYGNVLSMAQEELASFTDQMSQLNSVMDHYTSLLDMLGKTKDFETRDKILTSKANNIRNELDVYTEEYRMYSEEAEEWEAKMLEAKVGSNEYETYKKNWDAAREAANEAQENMLAKTEEWAEAMRAIVENNLSGLAADLEASLTGGSNFDTMLNSMDRANSLQEEYLTTTNKIYETNKLMRTAQQEIDKTSNEVAKRKMKDFIAETKQLQNQGQLSKYELEIQQAKYDLLLAEIALEEAQNAKSTVRLQRDSEGNFGYVYTADSSKTAEAEQKFADAQNKLYNIGLEGANSYNQKYAEAMSEMYNELTELQQKYLEGQFASEDEYQKAVEATKEYHYNKLKQFSSLYQTALTTDSRVIADAWSTDFNDMIYKTDEWKDSIDNYTQQAASELAVWASTVSTVMSESGLDNVNSELEKMAADSEALKEVLLGDDGLIAAVEEEVEQVGALSDAYIEVQNAIDDVIKSYEDFLGLVNTKFTGSNSIGATTITLPTVQGFDTGGYTGEWGSWGKLAMLHEKEMILNQQDTANLLKTMEFLDNIINTIDLQATNAALGGLLSSPTLGSMNSHETLEQSVKIEASFPNVSSRSEIEEAFETLINRASQYANRK